MTGPAGLGAPALTEPVVVTTLFLATWNGTTLRGRMCVEPDGQLLRVVLMEPLQVPETMRQGLGLRGGVAPSGASFHIHPHQVRMMADL